MEIKLTHFSKGAGCGCKVAPAVLDEILGGHSASHTTFQNLLVGNETKDDAAVYDLGNGKALISTVDFFTPVVNNPFDYGRIAAANALSDVYAMGGSPLLAIAVMGLPVEKIPAEIARQIIAGGKETCALAHIPLAGGHTIDAPEPFFGLAVTGTVQVEHLKKNSSARAGDLLYLTKPIGTGILTTALKRDLITEDDMIQALEMMCSLNTSGAELGKYSFVHAMTDVTGFGMLGHLIEMCEGAGLSATLEFYQVPLLDGVEALAAQFIYADNAMRTWKSLEDKVEGISSESLLTLCDPQTNGGLMIAVAPEKAPEFFEIMAALQTTVYKIGKFTERKSKSIYII
jgi:selenide,water dikinase